jgi:hypothetical protein
MPVTTVDTLLRAVPWFAMVPLAATTPAAAQWSLGLEAGPTYASWAGSNLQASGTWGAHLAGVLEKRVAERWTVMAAGVWQQKGALDVRTADGSSGTDFKSAHVAFPVTVGWEFALSTGWTVSPYAGVALAVTVDCRTKDRTVFSFEDDCGDATPATELADVQWDVPLGLRLVRSYPGGSRFITKVHHEVGLTQLLRGGLSERARGRTWLLTGGFSIPLF